MVTGNAGDRSSIFLYDISDQTWALILLSNVGKFGVSAAFAMIYPYSAEIFPTIVRNSAVAFCSVMARVGGMVAPQMAALVR